MKTFWTLIHQLKEFYWHEESYESQALNDASSHLTKILDAKYEPADLDKIACNCDYLIDNKQMQLLSLLHKYQHLFDANKSHFTVSEIEYFGYWITRNGTQQPAPKKVKAIQCIAPLTTRKQVQSFIGLINYYQDMWPRRSETLAPLTCLTSKDPPFQ
jgi:hypothetical protein